MYFCENSDLNWKKDFEFVFFSVMATVSFWVSFTGEIDNRTINNYKSLQSVPNIVNNRKFDDY